MPERRSQLTSFVVRARCCRDLVGVIYAVGGQTKSGNSLSTVEVRLLFLYTGYQKCPNSDSMSNIRFLYLSCWNRLKNNPRHFWDTLCCRNNHWDTLYRVSKKIVTRYLFDMKICQFYKYVNLSPI